jgi:hypothetical protein
MNLGLPEVLAAASQARPASRHAPVFYPAVDYDVKLALDELAEWRFPARQHWQQLEESTAPLGASALASLR